MGQRAAQITNCFFARREGEWWSWRREHNSAGVPGPAFVSQELTDGLIQKVKSLHVPSVPVFVCSNLVSNPCGDLITVKNFKKSAAVNLDMRELCTLVSPCVRLCVQPAHLSSSLARLEASVSANSALRYHCCLKLKRLSPPGHATSPCSVFPPTNWVFFSQLAPSFKISHSGTSVP